MLDEGDSWPTEVRGSAMATEKKRKRNGGEKEGKKKKKKEKRPRADIPFFPAAASAELPPRAALQSLPAEFQDAFVSKAAALCEKSLHLIGAGTAALGTRQPSDDPGAGPSSTATWLEDTVLADMARLRSVPVARAFVDCTLWRRLRSASDRVRASVDAACEADGKGEPTYQAEVEGEGGSRKGSSLSFKQMHMQSITSHFADDLAKLHEVEQMDGKRVQYLLRCLEEGANLFADVAPTK